MTVSSVTRRVFAVLFATALLLCALPLGAWHVSAASYSDGAYTYTVTDGTATVTDVINAISGDITVPATLGGYSVTAIGNSAFSYCKSLTSITLPDRVTAIGNAAFSYCESLTSITLPGSVTTIGNNAFRYCYSLTSITLPDSVTSIGGYAFYGCTSLKRITLPDSVTFIGDYAFYNCYSLTSITLPNRVTSIGEGAFYLCAALTSITLLGSVTTIEDYAFYGCTSLADVYYAGSKSDRNAIAIGYDNSDLTSATWHYNTIGGVDSGFTYVINSDHTATVTRYSGTAAELTIPATLGGVPVTSIGDDAFYDCTSLTSITLPGSVTAIGDYAFYGCTSLADVYYAGSESDQSAISIGYFNSALTSAIWYYNAFGGGVDSGFTYVINSDHTATVTDVKTSISGDITVPAALGGVPVTSIGGYAFSSCTSLTSITLPDRVTAIGDGAFYGCTSLTSITLPDSVTAIGDEAFYECTSLTSITLPDSVISIGDGAFYDCDSLTTITLPDSVTSIGSRAFYWCTSLKSITLPDSLTAIGDHVFYECTSLKSITLPDRVTSIGDYAFSYCNSLTSITLPDRVTSIGGGAFYLCTSLTSITLPGSVTSIGYAAFEGCNALTSITLPDSLTAIEDDAFYGCTSLTSITLPDSITTIGDWAFYGCNALAKVYYAGSESDRNAIAIGNDNSNLTSATWYYNVIGNGIDSDFTYVINSDHTATFTGYNGTAAELTLPATLGGYSVTSIGDKAFYGRTRLKSIILPDSVTSIGDYAFSYCESLKSITLSDRVTSIGDEAFYDCYALAKVYYAGSESDRNAIAIGYDNSNLTSATWYYNAIGGGVESDYTYSITPDHTATVIGYTGTATDIIIPATLGGVPVTAIEGGAFYHNTSLRSITIPAGVTSIEGDIFPLCTALTYIDVADDNPTYCDMDGVLFNKDRTNLMRYPCAKSGDYTIPNSVSSLAIHAFSDCTSLTSITLPDSITTIGDWAFSGCDSLTSITLPGSITAIGEQAFYECTSLTSITLPGSITTIGYDAFYNCPSYATIYYGGTEARWNAIAIGDGNADFINYATIYFLDTPIVHIGSAEGYKDNTITVPVYATLYDAASVALTISYGQSKLELQDAVAVGTMAQTTQYSITQNYDSIRLSALPSAPLRISDAPILELTFRITANEDTTSSIYASGGTVVLADNTSRSWVSKKGTVTLHKRNGLVQTITAAKGDTVTVSVSADVQNATVLSLKLGYDPRTLECIAATPVGTMAQNALHSATIDADKGIISLKCVSEYDITTDVENVLTLTFRVKDTALTDNPLTVKEAFISHDGQSTNLIIQNGAINVTNGRLRGDYNGDGKLNMTDAFTTYKQISTGSLAPEKQIAADMNGDGTINMIDAFLLYNKAAGK